MKATLEFNLPDDGWDYETALLAPKARKFIEELREEFRNRLKYTSPKDRKSTDAKFIEEVYQSLCKWKED